MRSRQHQAARVDSGLMFNPKFTLLCWVEIMGVVPIPGIIKQATDKCSLAGILSKCTGISSISMS